MIFLAPVVRGAVPLMLDSQSFSFNIIPTLNQIKGILFTGQKFDRGKGSASLILEEVFIEPTMPLMVRVWSWLIIGLRLLKFTVFLDLRD